MFEDNEKKLFIIVNRKLGPDLLMNATAHLAAGTMRKANDVLFHEYPHDESGLCAYLSHYPVVILQSKNSNQLKSTVLKCLEVGLDVNFFTTTMLGPSSEVQIHATKTERLEALEFVAIALYGDTEIMLPFTKKFSVFRQP